MSLIELIFGHREIVLSLGIALLLLLLAVMLAVVGQMRAAAQKRTQRQARQAAMAQASARPPAPLPVEASTPIVAAPGVVKTATESDAPSRAEAEPTPAPDTPPEETLSSAMKDILTSVFTDDERFERYALLLKGQAKIDIADLRAMGEQVADQLRARRRAHQRIRSNRHGILTR